MPKPLPIILLLTIASAAHGVDIVLRPTADLGGNVVRLGDVADVRAIDADRAHRIAQLPLMPAPAPGTLHFIRRRQIEEMLIAQGEDLAAHRITGAAQTRIGTVAKTRKTSHPHTAPIRLSKGAIQRTRDIVHDAILDNLRVLATASEPWEIQFELTDAQRRQIAAANSPLTASGGQPPWTGAQRMTLRITSDSGPITTQVVTRVSLPAPVVVATRAIPRGTYIRTADVAVKRIPSKSQYGKSVQSNLQVEDVVGMEVTRPIRPGQPIMNAMLRKPIVVRRGESVTVYARTGGVQVRTTARAKEDGSRGDLILVETVENREKFAVHVIGPREVSVFAAGVDATAYGNPDRGIASPNTARAVGKIGPRGPGGPLREKIKQSPPPARTAANKGTAQETGGILKWQASRRTRRTNR